MYLTLKHECGTEERGAFFSCAQQWVIQDWNDDEYILLLHTDYTLC